MEELWGVNMKRLRGKEIMEKRPNIKRIDNRDDGIEDLYEGLYDEQIDDRYFRIMLGIVCLTSVVLALLFMAAGAVGLFALIKFVFTW